MQRQGGQQRNIREVQCYNCQKYGHFSRDCRSQRQPRVPFPQQQGPPPRPLAQACAAAATTPHEEAQNMLQQFANANEQTQEEVLKAIWSQEDFRNA